MLGQGDTAAAAGGCLVNTHIATIVLGVGVTLLGAGVPVVSAGVATLQPTIFIRTVADGLTLGICGVGWTVGRALVVTRL